MTLVDDHEMILVFLHQILIISGLSLLLGLEIIFSRWTWSLTREKCENYYSYSGGNYSSLIMIHTFFINCLCDFFKSDSVNQVHVQHNEKLHHVSNITHSILSWLIFNCGGFCTENWWHGSNGKKSSWNSWKFSETSFRGMYFL